MVPVKTPEGVVTVRLLPLWTMVIEYAGSTGSPQLLLVLVSVTVQVPAAFPGAAGASPPPPPPPPHARSDNSSAVEIPYRHIRASMVTSLGRVTPPSRAASLRAAYPDGLEQIMPFAWERGQGGKLPPMPIDFFRVWSLRPADPSKRLAERQPAGWRARGEGFKEPG